MQNLFKRAALTLAMATVASAGDKAYKTEFKEYWLDDKTGLTLATKNAGSISVNCRTSNAQFISGDGSATLIYKYGELSISTKSGNGSSVFSETSNLDLQNIFEAAEKRICGKTFKPMKDAMKNLFTAISDWRKGSDMARQVTPVNDSPRP